MLQAARQGFVSCICHRIHRLLYTLQRVRFAMLYVKERRERATPGTQYKYNTKAWQNSPPVCLALHRFHRFQQLHRHLYICSWAWGIDDGIFVPLPPSSVLFPPFLLLLTIRGASLLRVSLLTCQDHPPKHACKQFLHIPAGYRLDPCPALATASARTCAHKHARRVQPP